LNDGSMDFDFKNVVNDMKQMFLLFLYTLQN
jgi:hypothetical protein